MAGFKGRKSNIKDFELIRLNIREKTGVTADAVPGCWGQPFLNRPECNPLVKMPKSNPTLRCGYTKSCAMAYAESPHRLALDISGAKSYEDIVGLIKTEEARTRISNEIPSGGPHPTLKPVEMSNVSKLKETKKPMQKIESPVKIKKPAAPVGESIRSIVVEFLRDPVGLSKTDIVARLEDKLNKRPLNNAALHKIALALQPKTQKKHGYLLSKERKEGVWYYKLVTPSNG
jgi:hypothetical protein